MAILSKKCCKRENWVGELGWKRDSKGGLHTMLVLTKIKQCINFTDIDPQKFIFLVFVPKASVGRRGR